MLSPLAGNLGPLGFLKKTATQETWNSYVTSLSPYVWHRFNDATSPLIDYGSAGVNATLMIGSVTYQQAGILGPTEALLFPALAGQPRFDFSATGWGNVSAWEVTILIMRTGSVGQNMRIFGSGAPGNNNANITWRVASSTLQLFVPAFSSQGSATTTDTLPVNVWHMLSFNYDDLGDKIPRIFLNGVECTYSSQVAASGAWTPFSPTGAWGNNPVSPRGFVGYYDEGIISPILTNTQRLHLVSLAGL